MYLVSLHFNHLWLDLCLSWIGFRRLVEFLLEYKQSNQGKEPWVRDRRSSLSDLRNRITIQRYSIFRYQWCSRRVPNNRKPFNLSQNMVGKTSSRHSKYLSIHRVQLLRLSSLQNTPSIHPTLEAIILLSYLCWLSIYSMSSIWLWLLTSSMVVISILMHIGASLVSLLKIISPLLCIWLSSWLLDRLFPSFWWVECSQIPLFRP